MKRIDKGYAIIYADDENEFHDILRYTKLDDLNIKNYFDGFIASDFYESGRNFLQWNFYMIVSSKDIPEKIIEAAKENENFARIIFYDPDEIKLESFIDHWFPDYDPSKVERINLIKRKDRWSAEKVAFALSHEELGDYQDSFMKDFDEMDTIAMIDEERTFILHGQSPVYTYYTHLTRDASFFNKKFGFLGDKLKLL